jgi:hypothetical protein
VKKGMPSLSHPQNCTSTELRSTYKTVSFPDTPKTLKATIEEVEDEDEVRMRQKLKLEGPGILEEIDDDEKPILLSPQLHPDHKPDQNLKMVPKGKMEHFLDRIRETK